MPELISILLIGLWGACTALLTAWALCILTAPRLTYCELCGADTDNGELCRPCGPRSLRPGVRTDGTA